MRIKKPLRHDRDRLVIFRKPIAAIHRKFDDQHGAETVADFCNYAVLVVLHPETYPGRVNAVSQVCGSSQRQHTQFAFWYSSYPTMFLETLATLRSAWRNAPDMLRAQWFIANHVCITTPDGKFLDIEQAQDGEISEAIDHHWQMKISVATVKKARQLLSVATAPKGRTTPKKSL